MAKRKRDGKRKFSHHQATRHTAPRSNPLPQLEYDDESYVQPDNVEVTEETFEEEEEEEVDYAWELKPLKSSQNGLFGNGSRGYVDPNTNQRGAFPELQGLDDEDVDYSSPAVDALSYLRMVRHEARGVPTLLTASQPVIVLPRKVTVSTVVAVPPPPITGRPIPADTDALSYDDDNTVPDVKHTRPAEPVTEGLLYNDEDGPIKDLEPSPASNIEPGRLSYNDEVVYADDEDEEYEDEYEEEEMEAYPEDLDSDDSAYYYDGAYIARSVPTMFGTTTGGGGLVPPRVISYEWHEALINNFKATRDAIFNTPYEEPEPLFPNHPLEWRDFMISNQPSLAIIQSISSENAIKALKHIRKNLGWANVHEWQGKWIWALLARTNDVGILVNEEVSVLRELGKKAVFNLGKAADARVKMVEMGGEDWWNEDMQRKVTEYMNGGGQEQVEETNEPSDDAERDQHDDGVVQEEDTSEQPPAKKLALFRPRAMVLSKTGNSLGELVPSISIIPATPAPVLTSNPMETSLVDSQFLKDASQSAGEDDLASAQLQLESEIGISIEIVKEVDGKTEKKDITEEQEDGEAEQLPRVPDVKTMFALDMIVSVVGDVFGQRDLLMERR